SAASLTVNWQTNSNPAGTIYEVELSSDSNFSFSGDVTSSTINSYALFGWSGEGDVLLPDNTYYAQARAKNEYGNWTRFISLSSAVTDAAVVSISIATDTISFTGLKMSTSVVSASSVCITNNGNVYETYSLKIATATENTPWIISTSQDLNQAHIRAAFNDVRPSSTTFASEDDLSATDQTSTATKFSIDGGIETGVDVDISAIRGLWINFMMPTASTTGQMQTFTLTITAEEDYPD
ncbi:hypothetical protein ACFL6Y_05995, partial [Elusimicrobiota bacterium]